MDKMGSLALMHSILHGYGSKTRQPQMEGLIMFTVTPNLWLPGHQTLKR